MKDKNISILVAVTHTGYTVTGLEAKLSKWIYESDYNAELFFSNENPTYSNRNKVCKYFKEMTKHTHLLFIDSDNVPFENPLDLVKHKKHIASGVYPRWKQTIYEWLAMIRKPDGRYEQLPPDKRKGLVECDGVGAGCLMMSREVLEQFDDPFADKIKPDGRRSVGHDFNFCERAKKKGYKVYVDWNILCDHVKQVPLIPIVQSMMKAYQNGYRQGLTDGKK
jgi:choline kinase